MLWTNVGLNGGILEKRIVRPTARFNKFGVCRLSGRRAILETEIRVKIPIHIVMHLETLVGSEGRNRSQVIVSLLRKQLYDSPKNI